jgi:hypothetical protein
MKIDSAKASGTVPSLRKVPWTQRILSASALLFLILDLVILPDCNPVSTPNQAPQVLEPGQSQIGFSGHAAVANREERNDSTSAVGTTGAVDLRLGYRYSLGAAEFGVALTEGFLFIIPTGLEADLKFRLWEHGPWAVSGDMGAGYHSLDLWSGSYIESGGEALALTPSLLFGRQEIYGGLKTDFLRKRDGFHAYPALSLGSGWGGDGFRAAPELTLNLVDGHPSFIAGLSLRWRLAARR